MSRNLESVLLAFFCLMSQRVYSQTIKGKIISTEGKPIAWASLAYIDNSIGTYSNELGIFVLSLSPKDSIYVHALGFHDKKISVKSLKPDDENSIILIEKPLTINEVIVNSYSSKSKNLRIGFFDHPDNESCDGRWGLRPGISDYIYLKNNTPESSYLLKRILVDLKPNIYDQNRSRIRIRIRQVTNNQQPGEDLLVSNVLIDVHRLQRKLKVDISKHKILFPKNGVFIGIEYIGWLKANGEVNTSWTFATRRYLYIKGVINHSFNKIGASYKWTESTTKNKFPHWFSITDGEVKEWMGHSYAIGAELAPLTN